MKKLIGLAVAIGVVAVLGVAWWSWQRRAEPSEMLELTDLSNTSVTYSWGGGFSLVDCDVHAVFSGDGQASLRVGDREPVHKSISSERYRQLLSCMAENSFSRIQVKRRWGLYQCDIGRIEILLRNGNESTLVYADSKHYIDDPELLVPVLEMIYSFDDEFGQPLDHGPIATTCIRDTREVIVGIIVFVPVLCCVAISGFIWRRKRKLKRQNQRMHPESAVGPTTSGEPSPPTR